MSQEALAQSAGLSHRTIGDIECGVRRRPRHNTVDAIAAALSLDEIKRRTLYRAATQDGLSLPQARKLIGREREFAEMRDLLSVPSAFITITGWPGVGKTALAVGVANDAVERFAGGVAFVALDAIDSDEGIAPAIAAALSVEKRGATAEWMPAICERLAEQSTLLILDNVEHLESAATMAVELMRSVDGLSILATGRAALHVSIERDYHLAPLELPAATELFLERAATCVSGYTLEEADVPFVERLCTNLDRLPLAIELAAMRVRSFSPKELCDRLWELMAQGPRDFPKRHRALTAAIGWSYDMLDAESRQCVLRFSAFAGGATAEAVLAVCRVSAPVIDTLVRQNLLASEGTGSRRRLCMLATVREFAGSRAAELGDAESAANAHAEYYCGLGESLSGLSAKAMVALNDCYEGDAENFRRAIRWALETGNPELAARMSLALRYLWVRRGEFAEATSTFRALVTATGDIADLRLRWHVLDVAGYFLGIAGDGDAARATQREAAELAHRLDDQEILMLSFLSDARTLHRRGESAAAIDLCRRVIRECDDENLILLGLAQANLGYTLVAIGDETPGLHNLELADRYYRAAGDDHHLLSSLQSHAYALIELGRLDEAQVALHEAMELGRAARAPFYVALTYENVAHIAILHKKFNEANEHLRNAFEFWRGAVDPDQVGGCLHTCALYFDAIGQPREAAMLHAAELQTRKQGRYLPLRQLREQREALEERSVAALGEATFRECLERGRMLTVHDALALLQSMPERH